MRVLLRMESKVLWGFHQTYLDAFKLKKTDEESEEDMDEENNVDMNNTMWLVLRKTKPANATLRNFFT